MKHIFLRGFSLIFWISLFACHDEEINITCADPIGSGQEVMEIDFDQTFFHLSRSIPWDFICFSGGLNDCFGFDLAGEQPVIRAFYIPSETTYASIVDVGEKECLGKVIEKPAVGWVYDLPLLLKHGYVLKKNDGTYGRFFVDSWEKGGDGKIARVNIVRQSYFY